MIYQPFQHTEPVHVYRSSHRTLSLLVVFSNILAIIFIIFAYWRRDTRSPSEPFPVSIFFLILNIGMFSVTALRHKLVISPAGISITRWRTTATPWDNVTELQVFHFRVWGIRQQLPCLVLHIPPLGHQQMLKHAVPPELLGRVLPILFQTWERPDKIEQDLQQYISQRNDQANRGLFVPHSFAATPDPNEKRNAWLILGVGTAAIVTIATIVSVLF